MADIIIPDGMKRVYDKMVQARLEAKAIESVVGMKGVDLCDDCNDILELEKEKRYAAMDALADALHVGCSCKGAARPLDAAEIVGGCMKCGAKCIVGGA